MFAATSAMAGDTDVRNQALVTGERIEVGKPMNLTGLVTHVSVFRRGVFVIADVHLPTAGLVVFAEGKMPSEGDIVHVSGTLTNYLDHAALNASEWRKIAYNGLPDLPLAKYNDISNGRLHARTCNIDGKVSTVASANQAEGGEATLVGISSDRSLAYALIPAKLDPAEWQGRNVRLTGCLFNTYDATTGKFKGSTIEASDAADLRMVDSGGATVAFLYAIIAVMSLAALMLVAMLVKTMRERRALRIVTAERRRLAVDLHDTVEQHLATAKLMLSGMALIPGLPDVARKSLDGIAAVLAHAKLEIRDAVNDLRSDSPKTVADALREIADGFERTGAVKLRIRLRDFPEHLEASRIRDLVAIVRESVTNAIKHGHAANIAIVADGPVLRILNDGEKFDPSSALGPETGHFGLAGMQERAFRSKFALSHFSEGRWCGVECRMKNDEL